MATQTTFSHRVGYLWVCVASASILSDDRLLDEEGEPTIPSLREEASSQGLCYLRVERRVASDLYQARVAAFPDMLSSASLSVFLSEQQLTYALPYDCRTAQKSPERVCAQLRAHAATLQPAVQVEPVQLEPIALPAIEEPLEITAQELQGAFSIVGEHNAKQPLRSLPLRSSSMQRSLLFALHVALIHRLRQGVEKTYALAIKARCAFLARLQRWHHHTREQVVDIVSRFDEQQQQIGWQVVVTAQMPF